MKRTYWVFAACLSLLLLGGLAYDVSAQQTPPPSAAPSAPPTEPSKPPVMTPPSSPAPVAPAPGGQMRQDTPQPPSTNTIERNTTVVDRDHGQIFGMQPTVALIIGAVLLVVIILGLVAMSRGGGDTEVHEHHHRV